MDNELNELEDIELEHYTPLDFKKKISLTLSLLMISVLSGISDQICSMLRWLMVNHLSL